ncbi:hypothetical protein L208DRAFT_1520865 [Tricholoma matsutake]|nr:hypothetical protein L208DRAFT_1520865 [Tricholoma matsutake 945]
MAGNSLKRRTISVFGNRCCGKSSLVLQFIENIFIEPYYPTIENIFVKTVNHMGTQYQCEIIDTAGLDEYSLLNPKHIIGVHGFILVYSVASRNSFDMVQVVYDKIIDFCGTTDIPCVIAGSKTDLQANRQVEPSEGEQLAQVNKAAWIETSAKENVSVAKAFDLCLAEIEKWTLNSQPEPVERRCVIM